MPKNAQTTVRLCSFHMLARLCSKSFKLVFSSLWTKDFQIYRLGLEKSEEPEIKLPKFIWSYWKQGNSGKTSTSFHWPCWSLWHVWITTNCETSLNRWECQTTLPVSWETCKWAKKQKLQPDMEQWTVQNWERSTSRLYIVTLLI